jgi:predicted small lipoprotein YifL
MQKLLMVLLIILILAGCGTTKPAVIVPPMEKYCPAPVRPVIAQKDIWTVQDLLQMNLTIIDYTLKLEETIKCWEAK